MKKALFAAAVAVAAVAGVIVAVVISSNDESTSSSPTVPAAPTTTPTTATAPSATSPTTTARETTPTIPSATKPVDTRSIELPPPPSPTSPRRRTLIVGVADDALAQPDPARARVLTDVSKAAGFDAVIVTATWTRGRRKPPAARMQVLRSVAAAAERRQMRMYVVVWHGLARGTPRGPAERADFAAFSGAVVKGMPYLDGVIVGNEPNLSTFWKPQFSDSGRDVAAIAYEDLLARSYDAIKAAKPSMQVIGGTLSPRGADRPEGERPTHSPTSFIRDLGAAYRASGRDEPIMDAFAFHPYMQASRIPPKQAHPQNRSITIADYPKLVALLKEAFGGTAQAGEHLPILYTEFGVQTRVPPDKISFYSDQESPARTDSVGFQQQADYYRQALSLAYCQPTVKGLFVFHTFDEADLAGWQSGLYFVDGTPKPSLPAFRQAVADLRSGKLPPCPS